jgi:hypothetical protein
VCGASTTLQRCGFGNELNREESKLQERLENLKTESWIEPSRNLFLFSNRAVFWLAHGTASEKRLILSTVGSNLTIKAKKLSIDARKPFQILQRSRSISTWCARINEVKQTPPARRDAAPLLNQFSFFR